MVARRALLAELVVAVRPLTGTPPPPPPPPLNVPASAVALGAYVTWRYVSHPNGNAARNSEAWCQHLTMQRICQVPHVHMLTPRLGTESLSPMLIKPWDCIMKRMNCSRPTLSCCALPPTERWYIARTTSGLSSEQHNQRGGAHAFTFLTSEIRNPAPPPASPEDPPAVRSSE